MSNPAVFTEPEKAIIIDSLNLKIASVKRFINAQAAGSPMAKAGYDTLADLDSILTKVGKL
jgi:hypothetical protein